MKTSELEKLVAVYGLPVPWLAKHVGHVSERTFRYWVAGRPGTQVTVPADVVQRMQRLNAVLEEAFESSLFNS
jgi:hypothetical protein